MRFVPIAIASYILVQFSQYHIAMARFENSYTWSLFIISTLLVHVMGDAPWEAGSATFYGDMTGSETMRK